MADSAILGSTSLLGAEKAGRSCSRHLSASSSPPMVTKVHVHLVCCRLAGELRPWAGLPSECCLCYFSVNLTHCVCQCNTLCIILSVWLTGYNGSWKLAAWVVALTWSVTVSVSFPLPGWLSSWKAAVHCRVPPFLFLLFLRKKPVFLQTLVAITAQSSSMIHQVTETGNSWELGSLTYEPEKSVNNMLIWLPVITQ